MTSTEARLRPQRVVFSTTVLLLAGAVTLVILLLNLFQPNVEPNPASVPSNVSPVSWAPFGGGLGDSDGAISTSSVVDIHSDLPAITKLVPDLRDALEQATAAAANDGQPLHITSGWRSTRYQEKLLSDAISTYGGEDAAREFVATVENSSHVTGRAVDVGPLDAQLWLMEHGSTYGLCQMFINERWHFELATTPGGSCPHMLPDASHL